MDVADFGSGLPTKINQKQPKIGHKKLQSPNFVILIHKTLQKGKKSIWDFSRRNLHSVGHYKIVLPESIR